MQATRERSDRLVPLLRNASLVGSLVTVATTFLPWAASGDRTRSSYAIVDVVERAGVLSSSTAGLSRLWYLIPLLAGVALTAAAFGRVRLVALTTGTIGVAVVAGGLLVARSPLVVEPGLVLAVGVGALTAGTGISTLMMTRRRS